MARPIGARGTPHGQPHVTRRTMSVRGVIRFPCEHSCSRPVCQNKTPARAISTYAHHRVASVTMEAQARAHAVMRRAVAPATLLGTGAGEAYVAPTCVPLQLEGTALALGPCPAFP
jgi:hypothetical protein